MDSYQTSQLTNLVDTTYGVTAQYDAEADLQATVGDAYIGNLNGLGSLGQQMATLAASTANRMVFRDNPQIDQNLTSMNLIDSLNEIIRQMNEAGARVRACTITATPTTFTGAGNGVLVASVRRPLDGKVLENSFAETVKVTVTADSYTGGVTEGNESLVVTGVGAASSPFAFDWPLGSNASVGITAIDGSADNSSGNLLTNSGFDNWVGPSALDEELTSWDLTVGDWGVDGTAFRESTITFDPPPNYSLAIVGDGDGTLTSLQQEFGSSDGTDAVLQPLTQYVVNLWIRRDGTIPAAGVLAVELIDENGAVIADEGGTANAFSIDLTQLTTTFTAYNAVFRTPVVLPDQQFLRLRLSTALTDGRTVYLDKLALGEMAQHYVSGPYYAVFAGSVPFERGDFATCPVTNSRGAAGTLDTFQTLLCRLMFNTVMSEEVLFPSSSVPTISDNLITGPPF